MISIFIKYTYTLMTYNMSEWTVYNAWILFYSSLRTFLNLRTHKQEVLLWHAVETSFDVAIVNWWAVLMLNPLHIFQQS